MRHAPGRVRRDRALRQQFGEQPFRVHARDHRLGAIGDAARDHACRAVALDDHFGDRRVEDDLDALLPRRLGHGLGDRAHAADRMAPRAIHTRRLAEDMVEQDIGRARPIRAPIMADDGVEAEQGLDEVVAEIAVENVGRRLREEVDDMALVLEPQPPDAAAELEQRHQIAKPAPGIGRRAQQPLPKHADDFLQRGRVGVVILRILPGVTRNLPLRQPAPAGEQIILADRRQEIVDLSEHDLQAMFVEPHVADDLRIEQADRVARRRVAEARMEFLGHRRPADDVPRFQHGHLVAALGQVEGAGQGIVPRPDHQDVAASGRGHSGSIAARLLDFKAARPLWDAPYDRPRPSRPCLVHGRLRRRSVAGRGGRGT